jgi:hypothetical protein
MGFESQVRQEFSNSTTIIAVSILVNPLALLDYSENLQATLKNNHMTIQQ